MITKIKSGVSTGLSPMRPGFTALVRHVHFSRFSKHLPSLVGFPLILRFNTWASAYCALWKISVSTLKRSPSINNKVLFFTDFIMHANYIFVTEYAVHFQHEHFNLREKFKNMITSPPLN